MGNGSGNLFTSSSWSTESFQTITLGRTRHICLCSPTWEPSTCFCHRSPDMSCWGGLALPTRNTSRSGNGPLYLSRPRLCVCVGGGGGGQGHILSTSRTFAVNVSLSSGFRLKWFCFIVNTQIQQFLSLPFRLSVQIVHTPAII